MLYFVCYLLLFITLVLKFVVLSGEYGGGGSGGGRGNEVSQDVMLEVDEGCLAYRNDHCASWV